MAPVAVWKEMNCNHSMMKTHGCFVWVEGLIFPPMMHIIEQLPQLRSDLVKGNSDILVGRPGLSRPLWRRTDLQSLEEQEPVLHTSEGPLGYRTNIAIPPAQAKSPAVVEAARRPRLTSCRCTSPNVRS